MGWIADLLKEIPSAARYKAELEEMEKENIALKQKVSTLETTAENLRQEVQRRDDLIQKYESHKNLLDDTKLEVLKLLFKQPKLQTEQVAQSLNMESQLIEFHLAELKKAKKVKQEALPSKTIYTPIGWSLDQEGTRYLLENKLV
ncbi:transcriptional regulator [Citrifermentans bremense]|uniref:transcriptional regulator n=1 Tax=Citrifermentans bremense TaxID=60035 RepID=UPI000478B7A2|nr:transcriptional regulator [Citrifermentans bremense]